MTSKETIAAITAAIEIMTNTEGEQYKEDKKQQEDRQWRKDEQEMIKYKEYKTAKKEMMAEVNTTNEIVSVALREVKEQGKGILYMTDKFSTYIQAEVISNKKPETVIKAFNRRWVREGPGRPSKGIFSEFKNRQMKEMVKKYGLMVYLIATKPLQSYGRNKRKCYTVDRTVSKLMEEDPKMTLEDAVSYAINAHNTQINRRGFSPRQLMFGKQKVGPGIPDEKPASMQLKRESDSFRTESNNRWRSAELYKRINANHRRQKILAHTSYEYNSQKYSEGERVLYKEQDKRRWFGPGKVTGMEGSKMRIAQCT